MEKLRFLSCEVSIADFDDTQDEFVFFLGRRGDPFVDFVKLQVKLAFVSVFGVHAAKFAKTPTCLLAIRVAFFGFFYLL